MTLQFQQIAFERHYQFLFSGINGELQEGELLKIQGKNGSGKTTLLRIFAGLLEPHQGNVLWKANSIFRDNELFRQETHYIGHLNGVRNCLTVAENLKLFASLAHGEIKENLYHEIRLNQLKHTQTFHLSAGQKRRLALARLLLRPAPLWILDEPVTALDQEAQQFFIKILRDHLHHGGCAIVATHQSIPLLGKIIELGKHYESFSNL